MNPRSIINPSTPLLTIEEDGGLATLLGGPTDTLAREAALREAAILQAARDELQQAFSADGRRHLLNPFAPAAERNAEVVAVLRQAIGQHRARGGPLARVPTDDETLLEIFAATIGWGPAQRYLDDPRVNEVKIIGRRIRVQENGKPFVTVAEQFVTAAEVRDRAMLLASLMGVHLDAQNPQETLPADHGTRIHATIPPRIPTEDGALICIRRGRRVAWDLHDVMQYGTFDRQIYDLLLLLARARCSFLIAGRTGSGKTALLEALANSWPGDPHILTIEDHMQEIHIRRATSGHANRSIPNATPMPSDVSPEKRCVRRPISSALARYAAMKQGRCWHSCSPTIRLSPRCMRVHAAKRLNASPVLPLCLAHICTKIAVPMPCETQPTASMW